MNLDNLQGSIERITFHNPDNGFCVLRCKVKGQKDIITVIGNAALVQVGEYIEAQGQWIIDKKHGTQFKAEQLKLIPPTTIAGIEKYLASGMIKGIGPHYAKILVKKFGDKVFEIIESQPHLLRTLPGIGEKRLQGIATGWQAQKSIRNIMLFLHEHGVGAARAVRIYKVYGDEAITKIRNNPYCLASDIHGIGFKSADMIAQKIGIPPESILRARAGLTYALQQMSQSGHCAAWQEDLIAHTSELLQVSGELVTNALSEELMAESLIIHEAIGKKAIYLTPLFKAEKMAAVRLRALNKGTLPWPSIDIPKALEWVETKTNLKLSSSQRHAVSTAFQTKVMIITGGPGVGKTTIVNSILKILTAKKVRIALAAPTGRAAKRLSESTQTEAKTIHRLLQYDMSSHGFKHNQSNPLPIDYLVVDEASMLDIVLFNQVLKALPSHAGLLLIGDIDQLPSVGPGAVLMDCIQSDQITTISLTEIFRQAAHSRIVLNAHRINQGELPLWPKDENQHSDFYFINLDTPEEIQSHLLRVVTQMIPDRFHYDPREKIQVLAPMNRNALGCKSLNVLLQNALNKNGFPKVTRFGVTYAPGDKVIQTINNYDKDVFNGDIGFITEMDEEEQTLLIRFGYREVEYEFNELDELQLAYAISIHKSQGSEFPAIVIPVAMQHYMMLARNLIYTGITRGKKLVVLIGQVKALAMAVSNNRTQQRLTFLKERLRGD